MNLSVCLFIVHCENIYTHILPRLFVNKKRKNMENIKGKIKKGQNKENKTGVK